MARKNSRKKTQVRPTLGEVVIALAYYRINSKSLTDLVLMAKDAIGVPKNANGWHVV